MKRGLLVIVWLSLVSAAPPACAQLLGNPLRQLLRRDTAGLGRVLARPDCYRLQILYTRISRDRAGRPHFRSFGYRLRPREYFYPASAVKLPTAALALEKMRRLQAQVPGLSFDSPLLTDSAFAGQTAVRRDTSAASGRPSIAQYVRKALLVSDNDAYNRLYEFVGPAALNAGLRRLGLHRSRLLHRLSIGDHEPGSRHTNPLRFYADTAARQLLYQQPAAYYGGAWPRWRGPRRGLLVGRGFVENEQIVARPLDFSPKNAASLPDLQRALRAVLFPESLPPRRRLSLAPADYALLRQALSQLPRDSPRPRYDPAHFPDTYAKFLLGGGGLDSLPPGVRMFNKIGQAYGFLLDNAYLVNSTTGVEFLLSAVLYVNADGILNDDQYEYDRIGFPFLRDLGRRVYEHETRRPRRRRADLRGFGPK